MAAIFSSVIGIFVFSALFSKGGGAWFFYLFPVPFFFAFPGAILGPKWGVILVVAWLIGFPILRILLWHTNAGKDFGWNSRRNHRRPQITQMDTD